MSRKHEFPARRHLLSAALCILVALSTGRSYAQRTPSLITAASHAGYVQLGPTADTFQGNLTINGDLTVTDFVSGSSFLIGDNLFAFGSDANSNAFLGFAGNSTMTGTNNTASGWMALYSNTTGKYNTASGTSALSSNTTGGGNTAGGQNALYSNTTGIQNTASGMNALNSNTTGGGNTATGWDALYSNTTADQNTADGFASLFSNTTGSQNTASGQNALNSNTTGSANTASGFQALENNTTGSDNTALGWSAGPDQNSTSLNYATAIGAGAVVSQSNALVLGGPLGSGANVNVGIGTATPSDVFTIARGAGQAIADGWGTYSSSRWKTNIKTLRGALGKVEQLRGVSYDLKANGQHEVGVIAEEVGAVVPEVVTWEKNGKDAQGVDYGRLTALLIEATKEQQTLILEEKEQIRAQRGQIARLTRQVKTIQATLRASRQAGSAVRTVKTESTMVRQ